MNGWPSLAAVRLDTICTFVPWLAARHCYVKLPSGRWSRTLGIPEHATHVRGNIYKIEGAS